MVKRINRNLHWSTLATVLSSIAALTVMPSSVFYIYGADAPEELLK